MEASIGHIRDLPRNAADIPASAKSKPWARLGIDIENDFEPLYVVPSEKKSHIKELKNNSRQPQNYIWPLMKTVRVRAFHGISLQVLKPKVPVYRLVFHEITKKCHSARP